MNFEVVLNLVIFNSYETWDRALYLWGGVLNIYVKNMETH